MTSYKDSVNKLKGTKLLLFAHCGEFKEFEYMDYKNYKQIMRRNEWSSGITLLLVTRQSLLRSNLKKNAKRLLHAHVGEPENCTTGNGNRNDVRQQKP
jgi:hypothetical protein